MLKFALNDSISVHKIKHEDPEIVVYVIDDFLENPEELIDYARKKAYFGAVDEGAEGGQVIDAGSRYCSGE